MKNTLFIYITMGVLFVVPLILGNIKKIWVRRPPDPVKFKPGRFVFTLIASALIIGFLLTAYQYTLTNRYEIATERIATQQAKAIVGTGTMTDFRNFVIKNGTENVAKSFDETVFPDYGSVSSVRFQISDWCIPKYWVNVKGFGQVKTEDKENPVYVMYLIDTGKRQDYYAARLKKTDGGWKYDWFGNATDVQKKTIQMPTLMNGKWYTVQK